MTYTENMVKQGKEWEEITPLTYFSYEELVEKLKREPTRPKVGTPFNGLNEIIGGFEDGRLYVLSAPPKQGKTTLAQTMIFKMAQAQKGTLFFTYEMGWQEVTKKFQQMEEKVNAPKKLKLPMFLPMEHHREGGGLQYQWMFDLIAKAKEKDDISLAVIDHLHFLIPSKDYKTPFSVLIGGVVREIKKMAVTLRIPIILICHTVKVDGRMATANDIRDSGLIQNEADCVMVMSRLRNETSTRATEIDLTAPFQNKAILSVEMDRETGKTGKVLLEHDGVMFTENSEDIDIIQQVANF